MILITSAQAATLRIKTSGNIHPAINLEINEKKPLVAGDSFTGAFIASVLKGNSKQ